MLGIGKKVKKVQDEIVSQLMMKADHLITSKSADHYLVRALVLLDIASVIRNLGVEVEDEKE